MIRLTIESAIIDNSYHGRLHRETHFLDYTDLTCTDE